MEKTRLEVTHGDAFRNEQEAIADGMELNTEEEYIDGDDEFKDVSNDSEKKCDASSALPRSDTLNSDLSLMARNDELNSEMKIECKTISAEGPTDEMNTDSNPAVLDNTVYEACQTPDSDDTFIAGAQYDGPYIPPGSLTSISLELFGKNEHHVKPEKSKVSKKSFKTSEQGHKSRVHVSKACSHCKHAHMACDEARPCKRCVRLGKSDTCTDANRKKRGRPPTSASKNSVSQSVVNQTITDQSKNERSQESSNPLHSGNDSGPIKLILPNPSKFEYRDQSSTFVRSNSFDENAKLKNGVFSSSFDSMDFISSPELINKPLSTSETPAAIAQEEFHDQSNDILQALAALSATKKDDMNTDLQNKFEVPHSKEVIESSVDAKHPHGSTSIAEAAAVLAEMAFLANPN